MKKLFFLPQYAKGQASNPYCDNFINSIKADFEIIPKPQKRLPRGLELLLGSVKADVYVLNWVESISFLRGGSLQALMALLAIRIIVLRKKKIVWIFHNIHPHEGENFWSKHTKMVLFKQSSIIITHSGQAARYAKEFAKKSVIFKPHPIGIVSFQEWKGLVRDCEFFIWGDVYSYKGVVEFVNAAKKNKVTDRILIVGNAMNKEIEQQLSDNLPENIIYENRRPSYSEVNAQSKKARYVVFPYVGESISSSGVLMDTLQMGGVPVGPNKGAFADLAEQGLCLTYENIDQVFMLTKKNETIHGDINKFINDNTWDAFGKWFISIV